MTRDLVLVVCTGNVCRSPYLHRRLALALAGARVEVASAGTGALVGHPMDGPMAALLGPDADPAFVAQSVTADLVGQASLVLTATRAHRTAVTRLVPRALRTTFAAADFAHLADAVPDADIRAAGPRVADRVALVAARRAQVAPLAAADADVADPFRRDPSAYRAAAEHIDRLVPSIVRVLR